MKYRRDSKVDRYIYIYTNLIYIYIFINRAREREKNKSFSKSGGLVQKKSCFTYCFHKGMLVYTYSHVNGLYINNGLVRSATQF